MKTASADADQHPITSANSNSEPSLCSIAISYPITRSKADVISEPPTSEYFSVRGAGMVLLPCLNITLDINDEELTGEYLSSADRDCTLTLPVP